MTADASEREQEISALEHLETSVLEIEDAPQIVRRLIFLRRLRIGHDVAATELIRVVTVTDQRDVPDRAHSLESAQRFRGSLKRGARITAALRLGGCCRPDGAAHRRQDCDPGE